MMRHRRSCRRRAAAVASITSFCNKGGSLSGVPSFSADPDNPDCSATSLRVDCSLAFCNQSSYYVCIVDLSSPQRGGAGPSCASTPISLNHELASSLRRFIFRNSFSLLSSLPPFCNSSSKCALLFLEFIICVFHHPSGGQGTLSAKAAPDEVRANRSISLIIYIPTQPEHEGCD